MSKFVKVFLMTMVCVFMALPVMAQWTEFVVDDDGNPLTTYPTLAQAVATAELYTGSNPIRIVIREGAYSDAGVVIDHGAVGIIEEIIGDGSDVVVFTAPVAAQFPATQANTFLDVSATTGLTIRGISIVGYDAAIATWGAMATDLTVDDCILDGNIGGVYVASNGGTFSNLEIMNGWVGIQFFSLMNGTENIDDNLISYCSIHDCSRAPAIFFDTDEPHGVAPAGYYAASMDNNIIEYCDIYDNSDMGIIVADGGGTSLSGTVVRNNNIYNNQFHAFVALGCGGGSITDNIVYGNMKGDTNPDSTLLQCLWGNGAIELNATGFGVYNNTVYDNGGLGTTGDGTAYADYAVSATGSGNDIRYNCFFDHAGVEGYDNGDGTNSWGYNYYEDLRDNAGFPNYDLDGAVEYDGAPTLYNNSAVLAGGATSPMEIWTTFDVDVNWSIPACAEGDSVYLGGYQFTVNYDPAVFDLVDGSADYDDAYFGTSEDALYTNIEVNETAGTVTFAATNYTTPGLGDGRLAFLQFQAIGLAAPSSITISSDYTDGDGDPIPTGTTPLNITV
ncbi:MAG: right-handed parallel beta-helix repeat-containing protein, partial [candidate division Zixibacteria bacterium]|nr:right-handed parallel beta-helix repeat-containing protein [candidate division Zixibacteria bacterium]